MSKIIYQCQVLLSCYEVKGNPMLMKMCVYTCDHDLYVLYHACGSLGHPYTILSLAVIHAMPCIMQNWIITMSHNSSGRSHDSFGHTPIILYNISGHVTHLATPPSFSNTCTCMHITENTH